MATSHYKKNRFKVTTCKVSFFHKPDAHQLSNLELLRDEVSRSMCHLTAYQIAVIHITRSNQETNIVGKKKKATQQHLGIFIPVAKPCWAAFVESPVHGWLPVACLGLALVFPGSPVVYPAICPSLLALKPLVAQSGNQSPFVGGSPIHGFHFPLKASQPRWWLASLRTSSLKEEEDHISLECTAKSYSKLKVQNTKSHSL